MGQKWVGIGCAAQLGCILLFNALTVVFNRYMQRAWRRWHGNPELNGRTPLVLCEVGSTCSLSENG